MQEQICPKCKKPIRVSSGTVGDIFGGWGDNPDPGGGGGGNPPTTYNQFCNHGESCAPGLSCQHNSSDNPGVMKCLPTEAKEGESCTPGDGLYHYCEQGTECDPFDNICRKGVQHAGFCDTDKDCPWGTTCDVFNRTCKSKHKSGEPIPCDIGADCPSGNVCDISTRTCRLATGDETATGGYSEAGEASQSSGSNVGWWLLGGTLVLGIAGAIIFGSRGS